MRERGISTTPPPTDTFSSCVSKWEIYDSYITEYEMHMVDQNISHPVKEDVDVMHCSKMGDTLKMIERIVNHNKEDEIYQDATFWEDGSDKFRNGEGSLLPLWCFSGDKTKKKQVLFIIFRLLHYNFIQHFQIYLELVLVVMIFHLNHLV